MFYELLMALNGYPGSIFIPNKDGIMKVCLYRKILPFTFSEIEALNMMNSVICFVQSYINYVFFLNKINR